MSHPLRALALILAIAGGSYALLAGAADLGSGPSLPDQDAVADGEHVRHHPNGAVAERGQMLADERTGAIKQELYGDKLGQTKQALRRLEAGLNRFGSSLERVLRLDVFLDDIYYEDAFIEAAGAFFADGPPAINIVGVDLEHNAEVELSAIAGA